MKKIHLDLAMHIRTTEEDEENEVMKIQLTYKQAGVLMKQGYKVFRNETYTDQGSFIHYHIFVKTNDFLKILPKI